MDENKLISQGYRKYSSEKIDVFFNKDVCIHSGNCVKNLPIVFNLKKKPWIESNNAEAIEVSKCIDNCPSGALKYIIKE